MRNSGKKRVELEYAGSQTQQSYADPPRRPKLGIFQMAFVLVVVSVLVMLLLPAMEVGSHHRGTSKCFANLKNIAAALQTYSSRNDGRYPDTLAEMISSTGISSEILCCPWTNDVPAIGTPAEIEA